MADRNNVHMLDPLTESVHPISEYSTVLQKGPEHVTHYNITASTSSESSATFRVDVPSSDTILDRKAFIRWQYNLKLTTSADGPTLSPSFAPRSWPMAKAMNSCDVTLNGTHITSSPSDIVACLERYNEYGEERKFEQGTFPSMPDWASTYQLMDLTDFSPFAATELGGTNSTELRRTTVAAPVVVTNNANDIDFQYTWTEPLLNPVFSKNADDGGITNITSLQVDLRFDSNLYQKIFSQYAAHAGTDIAAAYSIRAAPILMVKFSTPSVQVPKQLSLPYKHHQFYTQSIPSTAAGASVDVTMNSIKWGQVPNNIYVFAYKTRSAKVISDADGFLTLNSINVTMNNQVGLLSGCQPEQLYEMAMRNGCNLTYRQWSRRCGSPLKINVGNDIGGVIPGSKQNVDFRLSVNMTNQFYNTEAEAAGLESTFELCVLAEFDAEMTISPNQCMLSIGQDQAAISNGTQSDKLVASGLLRGGSFWKDFAKGFRHGLSNTLKVGTIPLSIHPATRGAAPVVSSLANLVK